MTPVWPIRGGGGGGGGGGRGVKLTGYLVVVASFTEIKTGYRGFETNEIRYFVYLLCALKILFAGVHE